MDRRDSRDEMGKKSAGQACRRKLSTAEAYGELMGDKTLSDFSQ